MSLHDAEDMDIVTNNQTKFRQKYRIASARLKNYDYSQEGAYFITICTKDREHFFGEIVNGEMQWSEIGKMAKQFWQEIETIHNFILLDEWIVMPNHIHGIIFIKHDAISITCKETSTRRDTPVACLYNEGQQRKFGQLQEKSIASVINHCKGATKKWANKNKCQDFCWQRNYYDRIIRNEDELNRIREYIFNNPLNWEKDKNNAENIFM